MAVRRDVKSENAEGLRVVGEEDGVGRREQGVAEEEWEGE